MKKKILRLALAAAAILAACTAFRAPRIAAPLSYGPVPTPPDEAFRATPPADGPLETAPTLRLQTSRLANGLEILLVERHDLPIFGARLVLSRGPRDIARRGELLSLAVNAVLREHESSNRANPELRPAIACSFDGCEAAVSGLTRSLPAALGVLSDLAIRPRFPASQLPLVQRGWRTIVDQDGGTAETAVTNNTVSLLFPPEDPYSHFGPEDQKFMDAVAMHDLSDAYMRLFQPEQTTLVVAGDVSMAHLRDLTQSAFGAWVQSLPRVAQSAVVPPYPGAKVRTVLVDQKGSLVHAFLVARGPIPADPTSDALAMLAKVLDSPKGALFDEVRSSMNATYDIEASIHVGRAGSWWAIGGAFELDKAPLAVQAVLAAVQRARDQGVSAPELEGARTRFIAELRSEMGTVSGVTSMLSDNLERGVLPSDVLVRPGRIAKLTSADLQKAAQKWLSDSALRLVVVGPKKAIEHRFDDLGIGTVEWRNRRGESL